MHLVINQYNARETEESHVCDGSSYRSSTMYSARKPIEQNNGLVPCYIVLPTD